MMFCSNIVSALLLVLTEIMKENLLVTQRPINVFQKDQGLLS